MLTGGGTLLLGDCMSGARAAAAYCNCAGNPHYSLNIVSPSCKLTLCCHMSSVLAEISRAVLAVTMVSG